MTQQTPADAPPLATALTVWQAWWEDYDGWDGFALYLDLDTAKTHAAHDYEGEEYGWPDEDDDEPHTRPALTWVKEHGSWHLLDDGRNTNVQVSPTSVYRPASEREIKQQKALQAAEEAERAAQRRRPMAEALEAEFARRTQSPAVPAASEETGR